MAYQQIEPASKQLTIVIGLAVVGFMAFGLALSYYRNALFEQTLESIGKQNHELKENIAIGYRDLEYFRSAQYKDKYAKENLGLVRPGENVLILTQQTPTAPDRISNASDADTVTPDQQHEAAYFEILRQMPIVHHWQLYFFHREKIQELKRSL